MKKAVLERKGWVSVTVLINGAIHLTYSEKEAEEYAKRLGATEIIKTWEQK